VRRNRPDFFYDFDGDLGRRLGAGCRTRIVRFIPDG
jgi:hypothetical protein